MMMMMMMMMIVISKILQFQARKFLTRAGSDSMTIYTGSQHERNYILLGYHKLTMPKYKKTFLRI
jgi:hypothetical protein